MVLGLILQYAMFYNAKCAFLFFFLGIGGLGDVQLVTLYSLTCFFLFNDLLIYLEILFLSYLLSLSMFYVIAFV